MNLSDRVFVIIIIFFFFFIFFNIFKRWHMNFLFLYIQVENLRLCLRRAAYDW